MQVVKKAVLCYIIFIFVVDELPCTFAQAENTSNLTLNQLVELIRANEAQYQTLDATLEFDQSRPLDQNNDVSSNEKICHGEQVLRFSDKRSFSKVLVFRNDNTIMMDKIEVASPSWHKRFERDGNKCRAVITNPKETDPEYNCYLRSRIWLFYKKKWDDVANDPTSKIRYDSTKNLWIVERSAETAKTKVRWLAMIDPEKDYFPVRYKMYKNDKLIIIDEFSKFTQKDGLWFPMEIRHINQSEYEEGISPAYVSQYKIKTLEINKPIPAELLDYVFPAGTYVIDRITGLRYEVGEFVPPLDTSSREQDVVSDNTKGQLLSKDSISKPLDDAELESILANAQTQHKIENIEIGNNWSYKWFLLILPVLGFCSVIFYIRKLKKNEMSPNSIYKNFIYAVFLTLFSSVVASGRLKDIEVDIGQCVSEAKKNIEVDLYNPYSKDITIKAVKTACNCIRGDIPPEVIKPHSKETLKFTIDGHNLKGRLRKSALVLLTLNGKQEKLIITFKGYFTQKDNHLYAIPDYMNCGQVLEGSYFEQVISIRRTGQVNIGKVNIQTSDPWIYADIQKNDHHNNIKLKVKVVPPSDVRKFSGEVTVKASENDLIRIPISGETRPMTSVIPQIILMNSDKWAGQIYIRRFDGQKSEVANWTWESDEIDVKELECYENIVKVSFNRQSEGNEFASGCLHLNLKETYQSVDVRVVSSVYQSSNKFKGLSVSKNLSTCLSNNQYHSSINAFNTPYLAPENRPYIRRDSYCGAYATWYAMKLFKKSDSIENIINDLSIDQDSGTTIEKIVNTLSLRGIPAKALHFKNRADRILLSRPFIAFIRPDQSRMGHFVFAVPVNNGKTLIFDGAGKPKEQDMELFELPEYQNSTFWDGTAIVLGDLPNLFTPIEISVMALGIGMVFVSIFSKGALRRSNNLVDSVADIK